MRGNSAHEWRCERVGRSEWPNPYTTALPDVAGTLTRLLADLGVKSGSATVVYSAPGAVTGMTSCASSVGGAAAEQAALLALANVADFPLDDAPSDTCLVFSDKAAKGDESAPQRHILASADAEQRTAAITEALEAANVRVDRLVPAEAVCLADAIRDATTSTDAEDVSAVVWIGEHSTAVAVGGPGRLHFVRAIATGIENLAQVLCRPLRPREPDAQPVLLPHDAARLLFLSVGVPAPDSILPLYPTLAGTSLLPHLQPLLQRLSIEIKQSLRFGVPEAQRTRVRIRLAGPGAAIPGLGDAISRLSGFPFVAAINDAHPPDALDSSTGGTIAALLRCPSLTLALMPTPTRQAFRLRRSRKALLAGAAIALAYVGYETVDCSLATSTAKARLDALNSALQSNEGPLAVRRVALGAHQQIEEAESRIRRTLGAAPQWSSVMDAIAELTPAEVRLQSLDIKRDASPGVPSAVSLRALVRFDDVPDPAPLIRSYVVRIEKLPIIAGVRLGPTQRVPIAGHDSQVFDLMINPVSLPAGAFQPALASHPEDSR
jgi:Tfp pilus assembly PilM family ATPase